MRKLPYYFIVFFASVVLAGCIGGGTTGYDPIVVEPEVVEGVAGDVSTTGLGGDEATGAVELEQGNDGDLLAQRVIYFEYDSSQMNAEGEAVVQAHARYLNSVSNVQVILEGHTDERGTREYNLALAEDRAKSVANIMQALGVDASRIQTVSYGEERPVTLGHDDSAWSLNRRVEILYQ